MPVINPITLSNFIGSLFQAAGTTRDNARLVANSLVESNLAGHDSHGVIRVPQYLASIANGDLDPVAEPMVVQETGAISLVDGQSGFGQIGAHFAMNVTLEKAKIHSLAATGLFNCNHVGRLGEWPQMAADQNYIGLAFCNGGRLGGLVTPYGGAARRMGTNPIAAAVPVAGRMPVLVDFATSMASEGKVRVAYNRGKPVPETWILNADGHSSTNPEDLYAGGMLLPMAEHKGHGLSLLAELLGGVLTGNGCSGLPDYTKFSNGVLFLVLSIEAFRPMQDFLAHGAALCDLIKSTPPAPGFDEVMLPGEPEERATEQRQVEGIAIDETTWGQLVEAAAELGVTIPN